METMLLDVLELGTKGTAGTAKKETSYNEYKKKLGVMALNSLIMSGVVLFATWSGSFDTGHIGIVLKTAGSTFFVQLASYLGLKAIK